MYILAVTCPLSRKAEKQHGAFGLEVIGRTTRSLKLQTVACNPDGPRDMCRQHLDGPSVR